MPSSTTAIEQTTTSKATTPARSEATTTETASSTTSAVVNEAEPAAAEVPQIVGCQQGMGPVETYWSDGSVTGYSDYCQTVHDSTLREEAAANTPSCDGTVCRYPSGATFPDPNATPDNRCTNLINYANDPRPNAEINSIGALTGQCPEPIS